MYFLTAPEAGSPKARGQQFKFLPRLIDGCLLATSPHGRPFAQACLVSPLLLIGTPVVLD